MGAKVPRDEDDVFDNGGSWVKDDVPVEYAWLEIKGSGAADSDSIPPY